MDDLLYLYCTAKARKYVVEQENSFNNDSEINAVEK